MKKNFLLKLSVAALSLLAFLGLAATQANAQIVSTLYSFGSSTGDGINPYGGGLIKDVSGNLYGVTAYGGANNAGTVFELANTAGVYSEKVLYSFGTATGDGGNPACSLIMDASGNLFGTTTGGGANGSGTVFELVNSLGTWAEKVLYSFTSPTYSFGPDGANPYGALTMDASGNLFGTTFAGGPIGHGTVFELVNSAGTYTEKVLYSFTNAAGDGYGTLAGLVMDASGNLYGTTANGGVSFGTVFELVNSAGTYSERVLYSFTGAAGDGASPNGALVQDAAGNLYGTTANGGVSFGTVFELVNSAGTYAEKVIYTFTGGGGDGANPFSTLTQDASGNLYGMTSGGGASGNGTVFELSNTSGFWAESLLLIFGSSCEGSGTSNGAKPYYGNLLLDASGTVYGVTDLGGASNDGVVFSIARSATPSATTTTAVSSANPVGAGFPVSFSAAVSSASGYPTGNVVFSNPNGAVGVSGPLVCGVAAVSFADALTLGIGTNPVTAVYKPASTDSSSPSTATVSQTVTEPGVVLTSGSNTFNGNQTVNGSVAATSFSGNGSGLTNVNAASLSGSINLSQVNGLATALAGFVPLSWVGYASGVASLDATGRLPAAQLPLGTSGGGSPAILVATCTGAASSTKGSTFAFEGLGAIGNETCGNSVSASTAVGIPMTAAGTLSGLNVYPGAAGNSGTAVTFTVYEKPRRPAGPSAPARIRPPSAPSASTGAPAASRSMSHRAQTLPWATPSPSPA